MMDQYTQNEIYVIIHLSVFINLYDLPSYVEDKRCFDECSSCCYSYTSLQ